MLHVEQLEGRLVPSTFVVTNLLDVPYAGAVPAGSLRAAVLQVNKDEGTAIDDTIVFDPSLFASGTQVLHLQQALNVLHHVTVQGPGETLLTIDGGGITNGWVVYPPNAASVTISKGKYIDETLLETVMEDFTMENFVSTPRTDSGPPIGALSGAFPGVAIFDRESLCVERMCFEDNHNIVGGFGGAVTCLAGTFMAEDCMFEGNTSAGTGGAIASLADNTTIDGCSFTGNSAASNGGALYLNQNAAGTATAVVSNSTFSGNTAKSGNAIYVHQTYQKPRLIADVSLGDFFDVGQNIVE